MTTKNAFYSATCFSFTQITDFLSKLSSLISGQQIIPASFQSEFLISVVQPLLCLISSELQSTKAFLVPKSLVESSIRYVGCWDISHRNFSRSSILMSPYFENHTTACTTTGRRMKSKMSIGSQLATDLWLNRWPLYQINTAGITCILLKRIGETYFLENPSKLY